MRRGVVSYWVGCWICHPEPPGVKFSTLPLDGFMLGGPKFNSSALYKQPNGWSLSFFFVPVQVTLIFGLFSVPLFRQQCQDTEIKLFYLFIYKFIFTTPTNNDTFTIFSYISTKTSWAVWLLLVSHYLLKPHCLFFCSLFLVSVWFFDFFLTEHTPARRGGIARLPNAKRFLAGKHWDVTLNHCQRLTCTRACGIKTSLQGGAEWYYRWKQETGLTVLNVVWFGMHYITF